MGWSVAVAGDTVVVGAYLEDSSSTGVNVRPNDFTDDVGAAYIFTGLDLVDDSPFAIASIILSGRNVLISFPTLTGKSYTFWRSDTLAPTSWANTGLAAIAGDGTPKTFATPAPVAGVPNRFYRVQREP